MFSLFSSKKSLQSPSASSSAISLDYSTVRMIREAHLFFWSYLHILFSFRLYSPLYSTLLLTIFHVSPLHVYSSTTFLVPLCNSIPHNRLIVSIFLNFDVDFFTLRDICVYIISDDAFIRQPCAHFCLQHG